MSPIACKNCGRDTNEAPRPEWQGYCPSCVTELFLDDMTIEQKLTMLTEALAHAEKVEVLIVKLNDDQTKMNVVGRHGNVVACETTVSLN